MASATSKSKHNNSTSSTNSSNHNNSHNNSYSSSSNNNHNKTPVHHKDLESKLTNNYNQMMHLNNGNATTSSGSSATSAGYDSSTISTIGGMSTDHYSNGRQQNHSSSGLYNMPNGKHQTNGASSSNGNNTNMMMMMMMNNGDDSMYSGLGGDELNNLMNVQLSLMDLPPDKLKIVKMLPDEKKIQFLRSLVSWAWNIFSVFLFLNFNAIICRGLSMKNSRLNIIFKR